MKQRVAVAAVFLATLGVTLWFFAVHETPRRPLSERPEPPPPQAPPDPGLATAPEAEPKDEPEPEVVVPAAPIRVLLMGDRSRSFTAWLFQLWAFAQRPDRSPYVEWQAWYGSAPEGTVTHAEGVPALEGTPTVATLDGLDVLAVAGLDPKRFPAAFWEGVAERVRTGRLGLLLVPDDQTAKALGNLAELRSVLPFTSVRALEPVSPGGPLAGVFDAPRPFVLTEEGGSHPTARIVHYPKWNRRWWTNLTEGASPAWATKMCPLVEGVAKDAVVVTRLATGAQPIPAIVASGGTARVLWIGGFMDVVDKAYKDSASVVAMRALMHQWVNWLNAPRP